MASRSSRPPEPRVITDPRAIKALTHPARLAVLDALSGGEELTATECAAVVGISASAMSYHLRALEKWGFIERAEESADGRERPWRRLPGGWSLEPRSDQAAIAATNTLVASTLERVGAEFNRWTRREADEPREWVETSSLGNQTVWLTADEARELRDLWAGFVDARRSRTARDHPDGARRMRLVQMMMPTIPAEGGERTPGR